MAAKVARPDQYIGEKTKQLREGFGVYNYANKFFRYEGEWQYGRKHGHGKLVMGDGSYYEGQFTKGEITGHGFRFTKHNSNAYTGQFVQGEMHGQGIMEYGDGTRYEGGWIRNKQVGYGCLKEGEQVYEGTFYEHKRHGEGSQLYENGDQYEGDWVKDKRQGHGKLLCNDQTVYEGQWRNGHFNGEGTYIHSSGMCYEGLWVNGKPVSMATKLVINGNMDLGQVIEIIPGEKFTIDITCINDEGEIVEDMGRELQIMAGYKYYEPKEGSSLFDAIEDIVQEQPIHTPFGYDIVPYPLTDAEEPTVDTLGMSKSNTMLTEATIQEHTEEEEHIEPEQTDVIGDEDPKPDDEKDNKDDTDNADGKPRAGEAKPTNIEKADGPKADAQPEPDNNDKDQIDGERIESPAVAAIANQRTVSGKALWEDIMLAPPPPMYRPFAIMEEEKNEQQDKKGKKKKDKKKGDSDTDDSRPNTQTKKKDKSSASTIPAAVDEKVPRLGDYVIIVSDVTRPPFMDITVEPAFCLVRVIKKTKKKTVKPPKKIVPANSASRPTSRITASRGESKMSQVSDVSSTANV